MRSKGMVKSLLVIKLSVSYSLFPWKGTFPASIWYSMHPSPHKSEASEDSLFYTISGATYRGVPTKVPLGYSGHGLKSSSPMSFSDISGSSAMMKLASPKSIYARDIFGKVLTNLML